VAERGGHIGALGLAWRGHVRGRGKSEREICRTGRAVVSAGLAGFEVGWGIARDFRGKGYAVEAARAAIDWSFATFELDSIIHCIDRENTASQAVARRLGAEKHGETDLFGHLSDIWVTTRSSWLAC
jgi:RimJ/RimL family protein N-acetyltransferase